MASGEKATSALTEANPVAGASDPRPPQVRLESMFAGPGQLPSCSTERIPTAEAIMNSRPQGLASVHDIQSTIDALSSRRNELQHKFNENKQKEVELQKLREQQQQMLLSSQLELEQLSHQFDTEIRGRESLQTKVQHCCTVVTSLEQHCDSVHLTLSQLLTVKNEHEESSSNIVNDFTKVENTAKSVHSQLQLIQNLQAAILEKKNTYKTMVAISKKKTEAMANAHRNAMRTIREDALKVEGECRDRQAKLDSAKRNCEEKQMQIQKIGAQYNQDMQNLSNKENLYKKECISLTENLDAMCVENKCLSDNSSELAGELKTVNESLVKIAEDKLQIEKVAEGSTQSIAEAEVVKKNVSENLQKMCAQNLELENLLKELRVQMETAKCESTNSILDYEEKLENMEATTSNRNAHLTQEVNSMMLNCSKKSGKCKNMKEKLLSLTLNLEDLDKTKENVLSLQESLVCQITKMSEKKQSLSCEIQTMTNDINKEKQKQLNIESSLREEKEQAEIEKKLVVDQINDLNRSLSSANADLTSKKADINLLTDKLEQMSNESKKQEEMENDTYRSIIRDNENRIALFTKQKELATLNNQRIVIEWQDKLQKKNSKLIEIKAKSLSASKKYENLVEQLAICETTKSNIQQEIKEMVTVMNELTEESILSETHLHTQKTKLNDLTATLQAAEEKRQTKSNELSELQQQIENVDERKANVTLKNVEEMNEILRNVWKSKQTCESLLSTTSHLNNEIDELKKAHAQAENDFKAVQKSNEEFNKQTKKGEEECQQLENELGIIMKACEQSQSRIKLFRREAMSSNRIYQNLCKGIAKGKQKKQVQAALNENLAPVIRDRSKVLVSVEVLGDEQTTPRSDNKPLTTPLLDDGQLTPRSILRSTKPETPQSEKLRKKVSFFEEDIASSSSSIQFAPEELDEIELNPAAAAQITARKIEESMAKKVEK